MNTGNKEQTVKMDNYAERIGNLTSYYDVMKQKNGKLQDATLQPNETIIFELKP